MSVFPKIITGCTGQGSNSRPPGPKSDALATEPPLLHVCYTLIHYFTVFNVASYQQYYEDYGWGGRRATLVVVKLAPSVWNIRLGFCHGGRSVNLFGL